jgi:hypothetical protein
VVFPGAWQGAVADSQDGCPPYFEDCLAALVSADCLSEVPPAFGLKARNAIASGQRAARSPRKMSKNILPGL